MPLPRKAVESSNISELGYCPDRRILEVKFTNGGEYHYTDVSPEKHAELLAADSIGRHFHQHVRANHECKKGCCE